METQPKSFRTAATCAYCGWRKMFSGKCNHPQHNFTIDRPLDCVTCNDWKKQGEK